MEHVIAGKATTQRERILAYIRSQPGVSREEIAHAFSVDYTWVVGGAHGTTWDGGPPIPLASVCGRVKVLLGNKARGWPAFVAVVSHAENPDTGHDVELLEAVQPAPVQRTFEQFARMLDQEVSSGG